jgi:DNA-directed RNA polymerase I, II, and III subunit RPABC1
MEKEIETIKDILNKRSFKITEEDEKKIIGINSGKYICVLKDVIDKFNVDRIKDITNTLNKINCNHCIIIYSDSVTSMAKKFIETSTEKKFELFKQDELKYNITQHILVPEHIKLSNTDIEMIELKKKIRIQDLPILLQNDPICRFHAFNRGDIIKIIRKKDCSISYRIVI